MIPKGYKFKIGDVIKYGDKPGTLLVLQNKYDVESWDRVVKNSHTHSCTVVDLVPREVPEYIVGYVNVFRAGDPVYTYFSPVFSSAKEANKAARGRIARLRVEFTKGQLDD